MATKKITDLVELTSAASGDVLPIVDISEDITKKIQVINFPISTATQTAIDAKQDTLVSGTNIKTINSTSILGSGDISISANPSGGAGAIQFSDGSAFASDASNLFWDNTNKRLGVGTSTPTQEIDVVGRIGASNGIAVSQLLLTSNFVWGQVSGIRLRVDSPSQGGVAVNTVPISNVTTLIRGWGSTSATTALLVQNSGGNNALQVRDDRVIIMAGLPISSSGLPSGAIWNDSGTLKIV